MYLGISKYYIYVLVSLTKTNITSQYFASFGVRWIRVMSRKCYYLFINIFFNTYYYWLLILPQMSIRGFSDPPYSTGNISFGTCWYNSSKFLWTWILLLSLALNASLSVDNSIVTKLDEVIICMPFILIPYPSWNNTFKINLSHFNLLVTELRRVSFVRFIFIDLSTFWE